MLSIKYNCEEKCVSCGENEFTTKQIKIKKDKDNELISSFYLCGTCLNKLAREFHKFS